VNRAREVRLCLCIGERERESEREREGAALAKPPLVIHPHDKKW
jgi:hypothetical protein